jgi:hypothetical protein
MKNWMLASLIFIISSVAVADGPLTYPTDKEGNSILPKHVTERCIAKGELTYYAYSVRNEQTEEYVLDVLEQEWNSRWYAIPEITWATHVDMQRIIRDAYRKDSSGNYIKDCCGDQAVEDATALEMQLCVYWLDY